MSARSAFETLTEEVQARRASSYGIAAELTPHNPQHRGMRLFTVIQVHSSPITTHKVLACACPRVDRRPVTMWL